MVQQASHKPVFPPNIAPYIDVAAYLLDARAPASTLWLDEQLSGRELLLLTRADQADGASTRRWRNYLRRCGYPVIVLSSTKRRGIPEIKDYLAQLLKLKTEAARQRGIGAATLRMVALGVPNVGKSTFLNSLIGAKRFKTGDVPGVTRGPQWVRLFQDVEVLDTAGILRDVAAIRRRKPYWMLLNLMPWAPEQWDIAVDLLRSRLPDAAWARVAAEYNATDVQPLRDSESSLDLLEVIAAARGYKLATADAAERAAHRFVRDFQTGRFGRVTLEMPLRDPISSPFFRYPPEADDEAFDEAALDDDLALEDDGEEE